MSDSNSQATVLLVSRLCAKGMQPLEASEFWALQDLIARGQSVCTGNDPQAESPGVDLGALVGQSEEQLVGDWGLTATPERLNTPGVGVVGSRNVSEAGATIAERVARCAVDLNLPLVSGGARGVDQLAMNAAFEAGGAVVGILAESLTHKVKHPDVRKAIYDGDTLMCTPYGPNVPFNVGNAMGRNKLIYAQTTLTVVVASDHGSGGTWTGATEALKNNYGQIAVWRGDGEGPGNEPLQERGATPLSNPDGIQALLHASSDQNPNHNLESNPQQMLLSLA